MPTSLPSQCERIEIVNSGSGRSRRNLATTCFACSGVTWLPCQPSPVLTVRRCAASERLPCHIGILLTGCGSIVMSRISEAMYFASKLTGSCDHTARIIAMPSSMRRPRSWNGTPRAANSASSQPTPTPRISRPPDRLCKVDNSFASGSGCRIGRASADIMAREGAVIVAVYNNEERLERTVSELREAGGRAHGRLCDALDPAQVDRTVAPIAQEFGAIDILVNAVGGSTIVA